jgi:PilZ domain-containing protein
VIKSEHRKYARERRRVKVSIGTSTLFTVDLSAGGFQAESVHVLAPGSQVSGTLEHSSGRYAFAGVVAWAKAGDSRMGIRGHVGVRFLSVDSGYYDLLSALGPRRPH